MDFKNLFNSIYTDMGSITASYEAYKTFKADMLNNADYSTEGKTKAVEEASQSFFKTTLVKRSALATNIMLLVDGITSTGYDPDNFGIYAALEVVRSAKVPASIIDAIADKYADNQDVIDLLVSQATKEAEGILKNRKTSTDTVSTLTRCASAIKTTDFLGSPEGTINVCREASDTIRALAVRKGIDFDFTAPSIMAVRNSMFGMNL